MEGVEILTLRASRAAAKRAHLYLARLTKGDPAEHGAHLLRRDSTKAGDSASQVGMVGRPGALSELSRKDRRTGKWSEKEDRECRMEWLVE